MIYILGVTVEPKFLIYKPPSKLLESAKLEMILMDWEGRGVDGGETDSSSEKITKKIIGCAKNFFYNN